MKNILLPTDFSENSKNAINYALQLFKGEKCNFYVLNIQKSSNYTTDDLMTASANESIYETMLSDNRKKLVKYTDTLRSQYGGETTIFYDLTDYDFFTDAVSQAVTIKDISLIVMGTNGATNAVEVFFGSNTLHVIRKVKCPVLVIPSTFVYRKPKTILYVMDCEKDISTAVLVPLKNIAAKQKALVRILKIKEDDVFTIREYDNKKIVEKFFAEQMPSSHTITNISVPLAIDSFVQIMDVDMTAIVIEPTSFLHRFFSGSDITAEISYTSRIPLLIMHPE